MVAKLEHVKCLDGTPVDALDRRCAAAFLAGGKDAELAVRETARQEKREAERRGRAALRRTLAAARARRLHPPPCDHAWLSGRKDCECGVVDECEEERLRSAGLVCSVCTQEFGAGDESIKLPCLHVFHLQCILRWVPVGGSCPLCRFDLSYQGTPAPAGVTEVSLQGTPAPAGVTEVSLQGTPAPAGVTEVSRSNLSTAEPAQAAAPPAAAPLDAAKAEHSADGRRVHGHAEGGHRDTSVTHARAGLSVLDSGEGGAATEPGAHHPHALSEAHTAADARMAAGTQAPSWTLAAPGAG